MRSAALGSRVSYSHQTTVNLLIEITVIVKIEIIILIIVFVIVFLIIKQRFIIVLRGIKHIIHHRFLEIRISINQAHRIHDDITTTHNLVAIQTEIHTPTITHDDLLILPTPYTVRAKFKHKLEVNLQRVTTIANMTSPNLSDVYGFVILEHDNLLAQAIQP